jgi:hypothetical protein
VVVDTAVVTGKVEVVIIWVVTVLVDVTGGRIMVAGGKVVVEF